MQPLLYQIAEKFHRYRTLVSTVNLSLTVLSVWFSLAIFTGFVISKQQDLRFTAGEWRVKARESFETVVVSKVIDGDTIELTDGRVVRYIGINTPDYDECFYRSATRANQDLLGLDDKSESETVEIILEKDLSDTDKYGRLLRYVWIGDTLINEKLVAEGFARSTPIQPDLKYNARIFTAHLAAKEQNLGLWDVCE